MSLDSFPLPNPPSRLRTLCVADPLDEVVLRTAVGRLAPRLEKAIGGESRVHVYSYRVERKPPAWSYVHPSRLQRARRDDGRKRIEDPDFACLGVTDVAAYYPSVEVPRLVGVVLGMGGDPYASVVLERWLSGWQRLGLVGLPIGIEASGLLGTAFLVPADRSLGALGSNVIRATDDYWVFVDDPLAWDQALAAFDAALESLALTRNVGKTRLIDDATEAYELMRELASAALPDPPGEPDLEVLREKFDEAISADPIDGQLFRFAVGGLCRSGDRHMIRTLIKRPSLIQYAPRRLSDCLRHENAVVGEWAAGFFDLLEQPAAPELEAAHAHILRGAAAREWGSSEGDLFADIAFDRARSQYTRGWGLEALARTPSWRSESAFGLALTDGRPYLQRAATLSFRSHLETEPNLAAVREIGRTFQSLDPTAAWVESLAA